MKIYINKEDIKKFNKYCYQVNINIPKNLQNNINNNYKNSYFLYENNLKLKRRNSFFPDIEDVGKGRYLFFNDTLFFSSTNNSNPIRNKINYYLEVKKNNKPTNLKRNSFYNIVKFIYKISINRIRFLNKTINNMTTNTFWEYYLKSRNLYDLDNNGLLLSTIFMKYVESKYFKKERDNFLRPNLEIGVHDGKHSTLSLDYKFDYGSEVFFNILKNAKVQHKKKIRLNINSINIKKKFNTIVMVHSIDDYSEPDPNMAVANIVSILNKNGTFIFSGFTDYYAREIQKLKNINHKSLSFFEFRGLHKNNFLSQNVINKICRLNNLKLIKYKEFNKDSKFIDFFTMENYLSKLIFVNKIRRYTTFLDFFRKRISNQIVKLEENSLNSKKRGINFFCVLQKL